MERAKWVKNALQMVHTSAINVTMDTICKTIDALKIYVCVIMVIQNLVLNVKSI